MVILDISMLRCIYQNDPGHDGEAALVVAITGNPQIQLLACVTCPATYLIKSGIPMMLEDDQLSTDDLHLLRRLRRMRRKSEKP